jgi:hypothetical protein
VVTRFWVALFLIDGCSINLENAPDANASPGLPAQVRGSRPHPELPPMRIDCRVFSACRHSPLSQRHEQLFREPDPPPAEPLPQMNRAQTYCTGVLWPQARPLIALAEPILPQNQRRPPIMLPVERTRPAIMREFWKVGIKWDKKVRGRFTFGQHGLAID